jgi:hypothetical protein
MFIQALNSNLNLPRFRVLYFTSNYSAILSRFDRRFEALEIRLGSTVFHFILSCRKNHHFLIPVEHDL